VSEQGRTTPSKDRSRIRWCVRAAALAIAIALLWRGQGTWWQAVVPALSPFVAISSMLATHTLSMLACLGLGVGVIALLRRRWFCRWICLMGTCADGAAGLGRRLGRRPLKTISLGSWILWLTVGGAVLGCPVLLWLDPLALFTGLFRFARTPTASGAWSNAVLALAVLALSFVWPGTWCARFCPLGALQDALAHLSDLVRRKSPGDTSAAGTWRVTLSRRSVLQAWIGAASAWTLRLARSARPRPLRPPGAVDEAKLLGVCIRCGNCIRACPPQIIGPDLGTNGVASLLTPVLDFTDGYCREDCTACTDVCPSGALTRLSIQGKPNIQMGVPQVDMELCLLREDRECAECRRWCPYGAVRYMFSETEYCLVPQIDLEKCNGCGACEMACPVKPKKAIVVVPLD